MIPLVVLAVAAIAAIALVGMQVLIGHSEPLDAEREEEWLVAAVPARLRPPLRAAGRRVVGGVATAATFAALFAGALVVGWIFSTVDRDTGFARWDSSAAEWGRENATETSTDILTFITNFGGSAYLLVIMGLIGLYHGLRRKDWGVTAYLAVVGVGVVALNNGLKWIIDRDRPDLLQLTGHAGSSFPSGHSAAAAACLAAIALVVGRRRSTGVRYVLTALAVFLAVGVAASRVLLGVHWLTDVIAGVVVGWVWFFTSTVLFGGRLLRFGEPAERVAENRVGPTPEDARELRADDAGALR